MREEGRGKSGPLCAPQRGSLQFDHGQPAMRPALNPVARREVPPDSGDGVERGSKADEKDAERGQVVLLARWGSRAR